jgi:tRNA pseudouridine55 synthase
MNPAGLLVIDKPKGMTSHDVVDAVRGLYGTRKVGHSGTLDPDATGVLLVGLGKATRLLAFLQNLPKTYEAHVQFGISTATQDASGATTSQAPCSFDRDDLEDATKGFVGEISQLPPMVSAVKVAGEPLYKAARRGEEVEREPRRVRVYRLEIKDFDRNGYSASLEVECSSGTYIRTLAHDIGDRLECGAHITLLRRTSVGDFSIDGAIGLEALAALTETQRLAELLSSAEAMRSFPTVIATESMQADVSHGRPLPLSIDHSPEGQLPVASIRSLTGRAPHEVGSQAGVPVAVLDEEGKLLAVYRKTAKGLKAAAVLEAG